MKIVQLVQGSAEWHSHRAQHWNASDAPAMMGKSPYKTRSQLLREFATGVTPEVDAVVQRRFDDGHRFEALARPLGEKIIGEELYPVVGVAGKLSASFDGVTLMNDVAFEHKTLNDDLRSALIEGCTGANLPLVYQVQMEQQCMVSGAKRVLFMASKWDGSTLVEARHCWYTPNPMLAASIIAGWSQFDQDLQSFVSTDAPAPVAAAPVEALPAVSVRMDGALAVQSNLPAFGAALKAFVEKIPKAPSTDQEFADTEAACKALKKAEDALEAAESGALASMADVEAMRRMVADFRSLARTTRLASEKMVDARKQTIRTEIVAGAQAQLDEHIRGLNKRLGMAWITGVRGQFGDAIKGKKTVAGAKDAVSVALANAKIDASAVADRLDENRKALLIDGKDWFFLFADFAHVGNGPVEVFSAIAAQRIEKHRAAEAATAQRLLDESEAKNKAAALAAAQEAAKPKPEPVVEAPAVVQTIAAPGPTTSSVVKLEDAGHAVATEKPTLTLGAICERLGFVLTVEFVESLGFVRYVTERNSRLFTESQYRNLKAALVRHIEGLPA